MGEAEAPGPAGLFPIEEAAPGGRTSGGVVLAERDPVARVAIDTRVPHLDRLFDYHVPAELDEEAQPGTRVRIAFHHRETVAWLVERVPSSDSSVPLQPLRGVLSPVRALTPETWALVRAVAARSAGLDSDVLRLAVPPRAAGAEKRHLARAADAEEQPRPAWTAAEGEGGEDAVLPAEADPASGAGAGESAAAEGHRPADASEENEGAAAVEGAEADEGSPAGGASGGTEDSVSAGTSDSVGSPAADEGASAVEHASVPDHAPAEEASGSGWEPYLGGPEFLAALSDAEHPAVRRVAAFAPSGGRDWAELTARACAATLTSGRRALVVVADNGRLDRLEAALGRLVDAERIARLSNDAGLSTRYAQFLRALSGEAWVVIGTRSAAFAPVPDLGLVACFDDGDSNLIERQAPYSHARDVLLLRAQQQGCSALFGGYAVSPEAQRLVQTGWALPLALPRPELRLASPHIVATSDSFERTRDPLAALARIPQTAHRVAREALASGPVLVQVARTGYAPSLACQRCRASARCPHCHGPLRLEKDSRAQATCRWCHRGVAEWRCPECGSDRWRLTTVGALRTAEELGRAFPQVPVVNSSAESVRSEVGSAPSLVVATPGAEPRAAGGYQAALLLDGDRMLARDSLRAGEDVLRRWMNACALVKPREEGGRVVCTAEESGPLAALVRWDPAGFSARELAERHELGLPPAVRIAAITGPRAAVEAFLVALDAPAVAPPPALRVLDAVPLSDDDAEDEYRALLFMSYAAAPAVTRALRGIRAGFSAHRRYGPVQIRCDGIDLL
ncbi:primosomal protein N' [Rothia halotolerans]|uniref:primosomal protein N' family DNA-binding protein n=1 Tax=Rothia halotolerans TaxID=405770 RepID=UPI00101BA2C8|nr:primosomal protein N' [Rothia halotolerans]